MDAEVQGTPEDVQSLETSVQRILDSFGENGVLAVLKEVDSALNHNKVMCADSFSYWTHDSRSPCGGIIYRGHANGRFFGLSSPPLFFSDSLSSLVCEHFVVGGILPPNPSGGCAGLADDGFVQRTE